MLIYLAVYGKLFEEKLAIDKGEEKTLYNQRVTAEKTCFLTEVIIQLY